MVAREGLGRGDEPFSRSHANVLQNKIDPEKPLVHKSTTLEEIVDPLRALLPMALVERAAGHLLRHRVVVAAFWVLAAAACAPFAPQLLHDTELAFTPPSSSDAAKATRAFRRSFPSISNVTNLVVLAETIDGSDITKSTALREYCYALNDTLHERFPDEIFDFTSYFTLDRLGVPADMSAALLQQSRTGSPIAHPTATIFVLTGAARTSSSSAWR